MRRTRLEPKIVARHVVTEGKLFVEEGVVSIGRGKRLFWRENSAMSQIHEIRPFLPSDFSIQFPATFLFSCLFLFLKAKIIRHELMRLTLQVVKVIKVNFIFLSLLIKFFLYG